MKCFHDDSNSSHRWLLSCWMTIFGLLQLSKDLRGYVPLLHTVRWCMAGGMVYDLLHWTTFHACRWKHRLSVKHLQWSQVRWRNSRGWAMVCTPHKHTLIHTCKHIEHLPLLPPSPTPPTGWFVGETLSSGSRPPSTSAGLPQSELNLLLLLYYYCLLANMIVEGGYIAWTDQ